MAAKSRREMRLTVIKPVDPTYQYRSQKRKTRQVGRLSEETEPTWRSFEGWPRRKTCHGAKKMHARAIELHYCLG
jgi:hypothetical protein